jgi:hypothetical protein
MLQGINLLFSVLVAGFMYLGMKHDTDEELSTGVKIWVFACYAVAGLNVYAALSTFLPN